MISLIVEAALLLLALFLIVPTAMIFIMIVRELIHQHRKSVDWRRHDTSKLAGG